MEIGCAACRHHSIIASVSWSGGCMLAPQREYAGYANFDSKFTPLSKHIKSLYSCWGMPCTTSQCARSFPARMLTPACLSSVSITDTSIWEPQAPDHYAVLHRCTFSKHSSAIQQDSHTKKAHPPARWHCRGRPWRCGQSELSVVCLRPAHARERSWKITGIKFQAGKL